MYVEISTKDKNLEYELMGKEIKHGASLGVGDKINFDGITIEYRGTIIRKAVELPYIITIAISFASGIAAGYVSNWLYDKIHGKAGSLSIDFKETLIDKGEITKIIEMKIQKKK